MSLNSYPKPNSIRQAAHVVRGCRPTSVPVAFAIAAWLLGASGCIALSIPSERYHDPHDRGGILGDFRRGPSSATHAAADSSEAFLDGVDRSRDCTSGRCEALPGDRFNEDESIDDDISIHQPKTVDVPWPRYHPVPTRPVFSGFPGNLP